MNKFRNVIIWPDVQLAKDCQIEDYCIIGERPLIKKDQKIKTDIGKRALIRSHTVVYAGNIIGDDFTTGHGVLLREDNKIGNNVSIGSGSVVEHHVIIGHNVRCHSKVFIPEFSVLEDDCWLGPNVVLTNAFHPKCSKVKECLKGPTIGKNAKIGASCTILPGVKIGENSLIGAGSVVVKDVPANSVAVGNPAKIIKKVDELKCPFNLIEKPY